MYGSAFSQFYGDRAAGYVGEIIDSPVHFICDTTLNISKFKITGSLFVSNPTVFYPEQFKTTVGKITDDTKIVRVNDSIYNFVVGIGGFATKYPVDTITFYLSGELLAGYDTVCNLKFFNMELDTLRQNNFVDTVYSFTKGPVMRYIRLARLDEGYPNPVWPGTSVTWNYNIDKPSDVVFTIYSVLGEEVLERKIFSNAGLQQFVLSFDNTFAAGYYILKFSSNSGDDIKPFIILK